MTLSISSSDPNGLLSAIRAGIDARTVETWEYDQDGDFTHSPQQWKDKAWLRPKAVSGSLQLTIIGQKDVALSKEVYAVYHGRFIEMLLAHFSNRFAAAQATPN